MTFYYGSGNDIIDVHASATPVQIHTGAGNDKVTGSNGNDTVNGGEGNDSIDAGAGNDVIRGGAGADRVKGGAGNDTFIFARGDLVSADYPDHIVDFAGAGGYGPVENDMIHLVGFNGAVALSFVKNVGGNPALQLYGVTDADGFQGSILVQMKHGDTHHITNRDYMYY
ncbi:hypothetical protein E2C06_23070 [Dankookia rubra]|uniref:Calcium-binding protein n=1 Tax=Dankookia rubra TaxID=1442381 RepID=A0A4V3A9Q6_9PROT|nr:hypothetical protein [Dankookia rubra]TDH60215.1 hypothetical protein E2C06_23070 [Dankookia rubra]